jgi:flagellar hook-associated protein 2
MGAVTFGGLVSGLDTGALVEKLVAAERSSADSLVSRQSAFNTQKSIVGSLSTALAALGTAVRGLDSATEIKPLGVTVSDSKVSVAVSSSASAAVHDFRVKSLAAAQITQSKAIIGNVAGVLGSGGVDITVAGVTKNVSWTSADSLDVIAQRINSAGAGVSASVINTSGATYRLVLAANGTGTTAAPTFADSGGAGNQLDFGVGANTVVAATDAVVAVDGIDVTRSTNVISDALTGVTLTLNAVHAVADPNAKATVALDQKALTAKVKAVVDAYNSVNSSLHVQLDYTGTPKGANTLFGDTTLRQLQGSLGALMSAGYGTSNLAALGISRDKTGAMTLDESKLTATLGANPNAVTDIFVTNGFASGVSDLATTYTLSGSGIFAAKTDGLASRATGLQAQIDRINSNADALQIRLDKQFAALEQAMSSMQSQAGFLSGLLK